MNEREELELLRKQKRLQELEAKESGTGGLAKTVGGGTAAAIQGFGRGLSFGQSDDQMARADAAAQTGSDEALLAAYNPMVAVPGIASFEENQEPFKEAYAKNRQQQENLRAEHPKTALVSEIAGGLVPTNPANLVFGAAGGALSETAPVKALVGTAGKATSRIANRLAALGEDFGTLAEKNALRSAGAQKSQMKSLFNKGRVKDVGRFIIDENIVPPGAGAEDIFDTAQALKKNAGSEISSVFDDLEKSGSGGTFNRKEMADGLRNSLYGDDSVAGSLDADKVIPQLEKYISDFESKNGSASARELLELKGKFDSRINYSKKAMDLPELQQGYRNLRGAINDAINTRAENLSNKVRGDLGKRLQEANRRYGLASEVENIAENRLAQEGNRFFSLSDSIAGAAGAGAGLVTGGVGAIPMAAGAALGNKVLRTYGPAVGTKTLDALSKTLKSLGPEAVGELSQSASPIALRLAALNANPGVGGERQALRGARRGNLRLRAMGE